MRTRLASSALAFLLACTQSAFGQEAVPPKPTESARPPQEEGKKLLEIQRTSDTAKRRELLEQFIAGNPSVPNLRRARVALLGTLYKDEPARALALADELLAQASDGKNPSMLASLYMYKFFSYQTQKDDAAIAKLGGEILEAQSDPAVLQTASNFDKQRRVALLEKAIGEKEKKGGDDYPTLSGLRVQLARALNERGDHAKAVEQMRAAIDLDSKEVAKLAALPAEDKQRRPLEFLERGLGRSYLTLARFLADAGEAQAGLDALARAESLPGGSEPTQRSTREQTRGSLCEKLGDHAKALDAYTRAFAFRMDPKVKEKAAASAEREGIASSSIFERARAIRIAEAQPFEPFELKNVEGEARTFADVRTKVTLVNFFFPT